MGGVRAQRQHSEEGTQHVLTLGDPRYGLYVNGMDGKQSCNGSARPRRSSSLGQKPKQENAIGDVQEDIGKVMGAGIRAE